MASTARYAGHAIQAHVKVDRIASTAERALGPAVAAMTQPILDAIRAAKTPEALRSAVFALAEHGPPESLATGLKRAMAQAFDVGAASGKAEAESAE